MFFGCRLLRKSLLFFCFKLSPSLKPSLRICHNLCIFFQRKDDLFIFCLYLKTRFFKKKSNPFRFFLTTNGITLNQLMGTLSCVFYLYFYNEEKRTEHLRNNKTKDKKKKNKNIFFVSGFKNPKKAGGESYNQNTPFPTHLPLRFYYSKNKSSFFF